MEKLTFGKVKEQLAKLSPAVTIRRDDCGEYVVRLKGSAPGEGTFIPISFGDTQGALREALDTGKRMSRWQIETMI